ncbi:MAG: Asp-tRNA(Asn)/Glu-tRNA(Gln) amidotransferase subunit GatA, partial [Chloroflexi bacterium]|nr:Asp-tRNA(Asn)/Glu-tRNA(Gln) amidotransferase subunit GatA [Chloroflexota bacterium]
MADDVLRLTMHQAAGLLRGGKVSSVELTQATFERMRAVNEQVNAFITESEEEALAQAARADQMIADGEENPLTGIPAAIKDAIVTKGVRTTAGSRILEPFVPVYDANVITLLKETGFVMVGKTNMDEFAMGSSGENSAYGPTHNPWALDRVP